MNQKTKRVLMIMILSAVGIGMLTVFFFVLQYYFDESWMLALGITGLTTFYHLAMRLVVGEAVTAFYKKKEITDQYLNFQLRPFEKKLHRMLKVKKWKRKSITAKPEQFDFYNISPRELLRSVMQAEKGHLIMALLSYVPLLLIIPFGEPVVFIVTSVLASLIDCKYLMIQRFNRPRVIRYIQGVEKRNSRSGVQSES